MEIKHSLLISNDDGPESPILPFFLESLHTAFQDSELQVVIPATEQSWIANAITRFRGITVTDAKVGRFSAKLVGGTPADCASLGIHNLSPKRPEFLFSGINMGNNAGVPYFYSSGTVGAALGGFLAQTKSAAVSVGLPQDVFQIWSKRDAAGLAALSSAFERLSAVAASILKQLVRYQAWDHADLYSINLPWNIVLETEPSRVCFTYLESAHYTALFEKRGSEFFHHHQGLYPAQDAREKSRGDGALLGDLSALAQGFVSITPVRLGSISTSVPSDFIKKMTADLGVLG